MQLAIVLFPLCLTKGNVLFGHFPSVFVFTFYCKLLNKVPLLILKNSVFRFSHQGKNKPFRASQGDRALSSNPRLRCCFYVDDQTSWCWGHKPQYVDMGFFTWGPEMPYGLQGIKENPSYCKQHTCIFFPSDPSERLHITAHDVYPSWSYLKGLSTFLGGSAVVVPILFVAFGFNISTYMWSLYIFHTHKIYLNQ